MSAPTRLRGKGQILDLTSSVFGHGQRIPFEYTKDGKNRSPSLSWFRAPEETRSFALICDDPDASGKEPFVHWVLYDVPAGAMGLALTELPEGLSKGPHPHEIPGAAQGRNDFGETGYDGPAPPPGDGTHHYRFKLYAVDALLGLPPGARKAELLRAMDGHILARGEIVGTFSR
jgi:Raf kinase inhibitor-like YbhB/YbcL family protein